MSKNGLHRMYDRLEADERFRLDVLAMARGTRKNPSASREPVPDSTTR